MAREKVYVDAEGNVVEQDDPSAAFIYDRDDAVRLGYAKKEKPSPRSKSKAPADGQQQGPNQENPDAGGQKGSES